MSQATETQYNTFLHMLKQNKYKLIEKIKFKLTQKVFSSWEANSKQIHIPHKD